MNRKSSLRQLIGSRDGATAVFVALMMVVLLGVAALAIDIGFAYVVRGELQNAADAGALAGAQVLYINSGTQVNPGANGVASNYVLQHTSEQAAVTVESVERGHWSFATRTFTPNEGTLDPVDLWNATTAELDANPNFINAVRVVTRRTTTNGQVAAPFFASIFGGTAPLVRATAVAYIGFAGTLQPNVADQPIAICKQWLVDQSGRYTCNVGRMLNSGSGGGNEAYSGTGGWTTLDQPCTGASNANEMRDLVCGSGNAEALLLGQGMSTVGGVQDNVFRDLVDCWEGTGSVDLDGDGRFEPTQPWSLTLPVIDCPSNNVTSCSTLVGAVVLNVVWVIRDNPVSPTQPRPDDVPRQMGNWTCPAGSSDSQCWQSFVTTFGLQGPNQEPAIASAKTIYFLPDCEAHTPVGGTGGENFGVLAQIPVLVR